MQDVRLIELLDKYNIKCTFNLNSGYLGLIGHGVSYVTNKEYSSAKVLSSKIKDIYKNHEVACHTLTHENLVDHIDEAIIYQINQDVELLEKYSHKEVIGLAYPCGRYDDRVVDVIKNNTKIKYAGTTNSTYNFDLQDDLLRFNPTIYLGDKRLLEIVDTFINSNSLKKQLLYIWGHSYEFDADVITWENFEKLLKKLSDNDDIFFGTNKEVLFNK